MSAATIPNGPARGSDGHGYIVLSLERENAECPQMSRYLVKRVSDGAEISNFPGYLLTAVPA